jgi:hypothetical protein
MNNDCWLVAGQVLLQPVLVMVGGRRHDDQLVGLVTTEAVGTSRPCHTNLPPLPRYILYSS